MWKKISMKKYGEYRNGDFPEDYELWLRWLNKGAKIGKVNSTVLQWNDSKGRLTRIHPSYSTNAFYMVKSMYLSDWLKENNPFHPNVLIWGASRIQRNRAKILQESGIQIEGYIDISDKRQTGDKIILYTQLNQPGKSYILVYVPQNHLKENIKSYLIKKGYIEGVHFLFVA